MAKAIVIGEFIDRDTKERIPVGAEVDYPADRLKEMAKRGLVEHKPSKPKKSEPESNDEA